MWFNRSGAPVFLGLAIRQQTARIEHADTYGAQFWPDSARGVRGLLAGGSSRPAEPLDAVELVQAYALAVWLRDNCPAAMSPADSLPR